MDATTHFHKKETLGCPSCKKDSGCRIDHLYGDGHRGHTNFGPWSCEECGAEFAGTFKDNSDDVVLTLTGETRKTAIMLVKLVGQDVYFGLTMPDFGNDDEGNHYFVEQHTCPSNLLSKPIYVIAKGQDGTFRLDTDPHGILEFVEMVPRPINWGDDHGLHSTNDGDADTVALFPALQRRLRELNISKLRALS